MAKGLSIKPIEPLIAETFNSMYELDSKVTAKEVQAKVRTKLKDKYKDKCSKLKVFNRLHFFAFPL